MKKYPEISYLMDGFVFYDGDYYERIRLAHPKRRDVDGLLFI